MKKIGVLFGMENTFPGALVEKINSMKVPDIQAEFVHLGAVRMTEPCGYAVIVDRISHDLPFYRSYLKNAVLTGTQVINNPFWWSADDKFFNYCLASQLGVAVPKTVLLPHKHFPPQINEQSLRNLEYPLDWQGIFAYVGFPAFLKPHDGGGWRDVFHVQDPDDFFRAYDQTRDLCMTLQAAVNFQEYFRCYVVGQKEVRIMPYDPRRPHDQRYLQDPPEYDKKLLERVEKDALTLCRALGYDLNTVEFAVEGGIPYAIDFMNPAPDADLYSVGQENFHWIVDAVARLAVEKATTAQDPEVMASWSGLLSNNAPPLSRPRTESTVEPALAEVARSPAKPAAQTPPKPAAQTEPKPAAQTPPKPAAPAAPKPAAPPAKPSKPAAAAKAAKAAQPAGSAAPGEPPS